MATACSSAPSGPTDGGGGGGGGGGRGQTAVVLGVGDIGQCGRAEVAQVARLVSTLEGTLLLAGDIAYFQGTAANFRDCFNPSWGQFRSRWFAVPGNHEYESPGAAPYFTYFGDRAGPAGVGYYSTVMGDWLILMLNSNIPATAGSPQWEFARAELQAQRTPCTMAVWHHPRFTSGPGGPNLFMHDMWALLEVLARRGDPQRARPSLRTLRATDAGWPRRCRPTGSVNSPWVPAGPSSTTSCRPRRTRKSASCDTACCGMTLRPAQVEWEFLTLDGSVADRGLDTCR